MATVVQNDLTDRAAANLNVRSLAVQRSKRDEWTVLPLLNVILHDASRSLTSTPALETNYADIVAAALQAAEARSVLVQYNDWSQLCRALDQLLKTVLECDHTATSRFTTGELALNYIDIKPEELMWLDESACPLADWLEMLLANVLAIHPIAIDIVRLHLEGYDSREVAQRLDLGLRLTKRIERDVLESRRIDPVED